MSEMYENEAMENENQEIKEVSKMKESGSLKGKVIAFAAGVIACGVGTLVYKHKMNKEAATEPDEIDDYDYFEDEEIEAEFGQESSTEKN